MTLRGVIFDMGGTLLDYHPPGAPAQTGWQQMENTGAAALHAYLSERGYAVPARDDAVERNFAIMQSHWGRIARGEAQNPRLEDMIAEVLADWGVDAAVSADGRLDGAVAAYVAPIQAFVRPLAGAAETLAALQAEGLRLGLVSNTAWPGAFHMADLERWGLMAYFECAFFSADVGAWKPDAAIFRLALDALDLAPEEALYIGDHPHFDVYGAQQVGMKGVWLHSEEWTRWKAFGLEITPDATLHRLPELLDAIRPWRGA